MAILIVLVVLALVFGIGSLLEGLAWGLLISVVLLAIAVWYGVTKVRSAAARR